MPIHDWTRVKAGISHDFHHEWISEIKRALNRGLLPPGYYAMAEQIAGGMGLDVLTLEMPATPPSPKPMKIEADVSVRSRPPKVRFHATEAEIHSRRAKAVVIRHTSRHQVIARIELVSPGNKGSLNALTAFVRKAREAIPSGIHLLIVDLFPPGPRDPEGIHGAIREEGEWQFDLPSESPLTCVAYIGCPGAEVFLEPVGINEPLPEMPLFLTSEIYVPVPLEATYQSAWEAVPAYWRDALTTGA